VLPQSATREDEQVLADTDLLNELIEEEFSVEDFVAKQLEEEEPITQTQVSMYVIMALLSAVILLLILIIVSMKKNAVKNIG
ncbi:MAG: hypothetical protein COU33_00360, partial [Candidatus Magasanikbacteria bacterium CG10_big_fil_rev_8_21_14_0_10_43_6]